MNLWRWIFRRRLREDELNEEIQAHLRMAAQERIEQGEAASEAHTSAVREFGNVALVKEVTREVWGFMRLETWLQDLRYGLRQLRRNPGFTAVAVITLALGIGANAAIFSAVHGLLLKPLAYYEPERIVTILHSGLYPVAPADFLDWRAQSRSFETMAAAEAWGGTLTGSDRPEDIRGIRLGEGMFRLLGVPALVGRTFQADDFRPGNDRVLVLAYALWRRRFGGDPKVVGQSITLNGESYTVVGVMPPQFLFTPFWATKAEIAAPLDLSARATERGGNSLRIFARLKPGVSIRQAQAEMDAICRRLEQIYPATNTGRTVRVDPLLEKVVGDIRRALLVLVGAVVSVLLIACANVANLLLVRAAGRRQEMALRTALGASPWRAIRQLLTESVLLATIAGGLGSVAGYWGVEWMKGLLAGDSTSFRVRMPRLAEITVDSTTLWFTLGVALLTGLVFGLAPAWQAAHPNIEAELKQAGRGATDGRGGRRLRSALVVAEIALALITLIGAGLIVRSFSSLMSINAGFNPRDLLSMVVSLRGQPDIVGEKRQEFYRQLIEKVKTLPGVESASAINHLPVAGDIWGFGVNIEGRPLPKPGERISAVYRVVLPAYFRTMGISLLKGRDFNPQDDAHAPAVAIINERFAREYWPNGDPIGKRVSIQEPEKKSQWTTIIGVAADVKQHTLWEDPDNEIYVPFPQSGFANSTAGHFSSMTLVFRTAVDPRSLVSGVQDAVWSLDRSAPISSVATMQEVISNSVWQQRFSLILVSTFGGLALLLGVVGIYGVTSYAVAQRTHEIGIRMALGAGRRAVLGMVLRQGFKLTLAGVAIGIAGAMALTRFLSTLLYGVKPSDPLTFVSASLVLTAVALLASYIPARGAMKVDPMVALRYE